MQHHIFLFLHDKRLLQTILWKHVCHRWIWKTSIKKLSARCLRLYVLLRCGKNAIDLNTFRYPHNASWHFHENKQSTIVLVGREIAMLICWMFTTLNFYWSRSIIRIQVTYCFFHFANIIAKLAFSKWLFLVLFRSLSQIFEHSNEHVYHCFI